MFCDVTLLTGADVKTFQGESGKKSMHQEKKSYPITSVCVWVCACVCMCVGMCVCVRGADRENERLQSI